MTYEEIADQVAKENGYKSFEEFDDQSTWCYNHDTPKIIKEIAKRYATKCCKATLEKAAVNFEVFNKWDQPCSTKEATEQITNPENIVLL